jgi:hypothetical protein
MVIDIPRTLLISEPWTTMSVGGKTNTKPMVVSLLEESSEGAQFKQQLTSAPAGANTYRVVDEIGPCYEFQGVAQVKDDKVSLEIEGALKFLR